MNEQIKKVYMFVSTTENLSEEYRTKIFTHTIEQLSTVGFLDSSPEYFKKLIDEVDKKQIEVVRNFGICAKEDYFQAFKIWLKSFGLIIPDFETIIDKQLFSMSGEIHLSKSKKAHWMVFMYFFDGSVKETIKENNSFSNIIILFLISAFIGCASYGFLNVTKIIDGFNNAERIKNMILIAFSLSSFIFFMIPNLKRTNKLEV